MAKTIADRIREMAEVMDAETIAKAIGAPSDMVDGFLRGEFSDEEINAIDVSRKKETRLVERKTLVRSRAIGIVSNDIQGSLLTSALAYHLAKRVSYGVAIADLKEIPCQHLYLTQDDISISNLLWDNSCSFVEKGTSLNLVNNLYLYTMANSLNNYLDLSSEKLVSLIDEIALNHNTVFIDCPNNIEHLKEILPTLDFLILNINQDIAGLNSFKYYSSFFEEINVNDRTAVVLSSNEQEGSLSAPDATRMLKIIYSLPVIGSINYDSFYKVPNASIVDYKGKYIKGINTVLDYLFPETKKAEGGFLSKIFK